MLEGLFGNKNAEKIVFYLNKNDGATANHLARTLHITLSVVQKQLVRFEKGGILISHFEGNKKIYCWNPAWPFYSALRKFLSYKNTLLRNQLKDPADSTYLLPEERFALCEELTQQGRLLQQKISFKPFVKTFNSFLEYEEWCQKQKTS